MVALPFYELEISQSEKCDNFKPLVIVKKGALVTACKCVVLKGSQILSFEEHFSDLVFDEILAPLFENIL